MNKQVAKFAQSLTIFLIFIASIYRSGKIVETDVYWQTRAGLDWLSDKTFIKNDLWSYVPNGEWIPNSWGWNLVLAYAYRLSNDYGLFALGFVVTISFLALLVVAARRLTSSWNSINHVLAFVLMFAIPILSIRPALISAYGMLIMLLSTHAFLKAFQTRPIIMSFVFLIFNVLMINLHLAWPIFLGAAFIGWSGLLLSYLPYKKALSTILPLGIAAVIGIFISPLKQHLFSHMLMTFVSSTELIYEWKPMWNEPLYLFGLVLVFAQIRPAKKFKRIRPWAFCSMALAVMGIFAIRYMPWALLFSLPAWSFWIRSFQVKKDKFLSIAGIGLAIALIFISYEAITLHGRPSFLEDIKALPANCRLIATPQTSGAVVLFRPDVKIFVDSRNEYWGKGRYKLVNEFMKHPNDDLLTAIEPTCVMVERNSPVANYFRYHPGWEIKNSGTPSMEIWSSAALPQY